jgi:predicted flap endonuclease-1-like 5' DNA nuclease
MPNGWGKLQSIEGIGPRYANKLRQAGIRSTRLLIEAGATPKGRRELAEKLAISPKLILEWVNLADLIRIKGVGEEYSDLLEEAGVDTVVELSQRNPTNLYQTLQATNQTKQLVRRLPSQRQVSDWVRQAKKLPRIIQY